MSLKNRFLDLQKLVAKVIVEFLLPRKYQRKLLLIITLQSNLMWLSERRKIQMPHKEVHYELWQRSYFRYLTEYWFRGGGSLDISNKEEMTKKSIRKLCDEELK